MKKIVICLFSLILIFLGVTCTTLQNNLSKIEKLVPADAVFYINVTSFDDLLTDADEFLEETGQKVLVQNMPVKDYIIALMEDEKDKKLIDYFDLSQPFGMAIMLGEHDPAENVWPVLYMPLLDPEVNYEILVSEYFKESANMPSELVDNYIIVHSPELPEKYLNPEQTINLSQFKNYRTGSVAAYLDLEKLWNIIKTDNPNPASDLMKLPGLGDELTFSQRKLFGQILNDLLNQLGNITSCFINVYANKAGFGASTHVAVKKDSEIQKILNDVKPGPRIMDILNYIPANYLFSGSSSFSPEAQYKIGEKINKIFLGLIEIPEDIREAYLGNQRSLSKTLGQRSAYAFDFDVDMDMIMKFARNFESGNGPDLNAIKKFLTSDFFTLKLIGVQELRDADGYRTALQNVFNDPLLKSILDEINVKLIIQYQTNRTENSFTFDSIDFAVKMDMLESGMNSEGIILNAALSFLTSKLHYYLHFKDSKCYFFFGTGKVEQLRKFVEDEGFPENNLASNADVRERIKPGTNFAGHFSVTKLAAMIQKILTPDKPSTIKYSGSPGILWNATITPDTADGELFWSSGDIKSIFDSVEKTKLPDLRHLLGSL
ncbi:MAG: hypothetical protein JW969_20305 [Spirochaetales bacterium]|nr:hypothetical protein [Spirochaetales bacterium]